MSDYGKVQLNSDGSINDGRPAAPKGYYGEAADGSRSPGFRSRDAMTAAMGDERYAKDVEYRNAVQQHVGAMPDAVVYGGPNEEQLRRERLTVNAVEVVTDQITALISDPRYAVSASYRQYVQDCIAQSQNSAWVASRPLGDQSGATRVQLASDSTFGSTGKPRAEEFYDEQ